MFARGLKVIFPAPLNRLRVDVKTFAGKSRPLFYPRAQGRGSSAKILSKVGSLRISGLVVNMLQQRHVFLWRLDRKLVNVIRVKLTGVGELFFFWAGHVVMIPGCTVTMMKEHQFNTEFDKGALEDGCKQLGIVLTATQEQQLLGHLGLLLKWNRRLNLTAIDSMNDMIVQHLLDSLAIVPFVRGRSLLDIGSGGGFPGMPLAIVDPRLAVTLLDSRGKRIEFLRYACATLGIGNVQLARQRAEDYRPGVKFDTLATRAFASLADTLKLTAGLHHPGCRILAMKGKIPDREIALLDPVFRDRVTIENLNVPFLAAERHLIIIEF